MTARGLERPQVAIRLLGAVSVRLDGRPVEVGGERVRALLAVLALAGGEPLPTPALAERVWGDDPPANIGPSLHTLANRLRRAIGADLVVSGTAGYSLRITPDDVDALRFVSLVRSTVNSDDPERESAVLVEALGLWAGRPFEGVRSDWLESSEGPRLQEQYLAAVERRVDLRVDDREYGEVLGELLDLTTAYPLRESLWVRLLRLLARAGRTAEALELYESVRVRIADELGVDPGTELRAVYAALLDSDPVAPPQKVVPRQLPADVPGFTGRGASLEQLDGVLAGWDPDGAAVLVAIDGTGGVGKTTLAVHWAHSVRAHFPDGQLYVNLRGYSAGGLLQPENALEQLLHGLGVPVSEMPKDVEARSALFRSTVAERRMLLVLDNVRNVAQVRPLLPGAGGFVLVTSRNQLRGLVAREGAQRLSLGPMSAEESTALLAIAVADRPYDVTELTAFAELCGRLPLALVIAAERAGRSAGSDLAAITRQLAETGDRLDELEIADDELSSVRAALSWSYQALAPEAARLFRLLGVYPAPVFGRAAAAALAALDDVTAERLLDHLVEVNLVELVEPGRYQLHDLLRLYAAGLADDSEESRDALARSLDWLAQSALSAQITRRNKARRVLLDPLPGVRAVQFVGDADALAWFDREWPTMVAAIFAGAERGHDRLVACLGSALWDYLDQGRSPSPESVAAHETAVQAAQRTGEPLLEAVVTNQSAVSFGMSGRYAESRDQFLRALELFTILGERSGMAKVHSNLGITYKRLGDLELSLEHLQTGLTVNDDVTSIGGTYNNLSTTYYALGRYDEAIAAAREAIGLARRTGHARGEADALDSLGMAQLAGGQFEQAVASLEEAVRMCGELQLGALEVPTLISLGDAYDACHRPTDAVNAWQRALEAADRYGPSTYFKRDEILERLGTGAAAEGRDAV
ncbi:BTAD domain-containing putative transcriptional regulator [Kribbella sp. NPDC051770]|uniref:AfsR/SARP family transcriptional regulator n=1 Tax=Kribbella sp. NPDC051770 TaxID=3155413 RepID=UPI003435C7D8